MPASPGDSPSPSSLYPHPHAGHMMKGLKAGHGQRQRRCHETTPTCPVLDHDSHLLNRQRSLCTSSLSSKPHHAKHCMARTRTCAHTTLAHAAPLTLNISNSYTNAPSAGAWTNYKLTQHLSPPLPILGQTRRALRSQCPTAPSATLMCCEWPFGRARPSCCPPRQTLSSRMCPECC